MTPLISVLCTFCLTSEVNIADPPAFFDSLYSNIDDVFFEYEGYNKAKLPEPENKGGSYWFDRETFSGSLLFRKDGSLKLESIHHRQAAPNLQIRKETIHKKISSFKVETIHYFESDNSRNAESKKSSFTDSIYPGSSTRIFMVPYLHALSRYPKTRLVHEGEANIDGHRCEIFSFITGKDYETTSVKNAAGVTRFYLDMERGGHAIKVEDLDNNEISSRIIDVKLESFPIDDGERLWFPISATFESILTKNIPPQIPFKPGTVITMETFSVMQGSVKFNKKPTDKEFELRLKDGTLITEKIKDKKNREAAKSKSATLNLEQQQAKLKELIREGEEKGSEITAESLARGGGSPLMKWIPFTFSIISVSGLAIAALLYRKGI